MSNIQEYTNTCIQKADGKAERLRSVANVIGTEGSYEDGVCTAADVQQMMKRSIKETATELQNLVREMAEQLDAERAEVERMKRLYEMARKDYREMRMQHAVLGTELDDLKAKAQ
jgi:hypothetical protein